VKHNIQWHVSWPFWPTPRGWFFISNPDGTLTYERF
jgi:hypothetical protein